ncbi:hypothetical protein D3C77_524570 [compost metagenome]
MAHQRCVALQGLARKRALGLEPGCHFTQKRRRRPNVALQFKITNVAFYQDHLYPPISKVLWWQVGVGQQIAILLVASSQALSCFAQFSQRDITINQRFVVLAQIAQGVNRTAGKAHLVQAYPGAPIKLQRLRCRHRYLQARGGRPVAVDGQVGGRQATLDFIADQIGWQGFCARPARPTKTEYRDGQRTHVALHDPDKFENTGTVPSSASSVGGACADV